MRVSGIWALYILVGAALIILNFSCDGRTTFSVSDVIFTDSGASIRMVNRKLKENGRNPGTERKPDAHNINLEDYRPIDPVPSSKTSIKPGPIEHGTPLNPFIPKPAPPSPGHPRDGVLESTSDLCCLRCVCNSCVKVDENSQCYCPLCVNVNKSTLTKTGDMATGS